ncbi:hypothetical protein MKX03_021782 [Papaver bracteatum]|nr:hypothetical protein MKX03_021782 [Papaver bracteatum]
MDSSDAEISKIQDPFHWLIYFSPVAKEDLKAFGLGCDWRRSSITTCMPFYSPLDEQPCACHDRASGEGVLPQGYTLIKMEVITTFPAKTEALEGKRVFLAAAALRPDAIYGETNAWVLAEGKFGANLCLVELIRQDSIGFPLWPPLSFNEIIYTLPVMNVLTDKGTGIVTSVPSDSPFSAKDEWILPFEVVPIINIPEFGDKSAERVCMDLKIKSHNEKEKLAEAKRLAYLKGFTEGTMLAGEFAGMRVQDAKPLIREKLLKKARQLVTVNQRRKLCPDQEEEWRKIAEECLSNMKLYHDETRNALDHTLSWLNKWGRSRSFGLGTRIPFNDSSSSSLYLIPLSTFRIAPLPICYKMGKSGVSYWYLFDLRVSGKELIQNHLTFTYTAPLAQQYSPRGFRCNGHFMLNSEKISQVYWKFQDTSFALADAGDGMDDANFVSNTSISVIVTKEISWMEEILDYESSLRPGPPSTCAEFPNEINIAVTETEKNFNEYMFQDALQTGYLQSAITPICPHYAEYVWRKLLKKDSFTIKAGWPMADRPDLTLRRANMYLQDTIATMRKLLEKQISGSKKTKKKASPVTLPKIQPALKQSNVGQQANFKQVQKLYLIKW